MLGPKAGKGRGMGEGRMATLLVICPDSSYQDKRGGWIDFQPPLWIVIDISLVLRRLPRCGTLAGGAPVLLGSASHFGPGFGGEGGAEITFAGGGSNGHDDLAFVL